jgi:site-specific DNA-methyltransferase (adenine-specific)
MLNSTFVHRGAQDTFSGQSFDFDFEFSGNAFITDFAAMEWGPSWGSFQSASNPCLRDVHEYLLVFSKGDYKLQRSKQERAEGRLDTIPKEDFIQHTKSIWSFATERASRVNHPAPFPVELPKRCIEMYSFTGDIVLDPFNGSGTTSVAAKQHGRHYIGVDLSSEYCAIAEERLSTTASPQLDELMN